MNDGLMSTLVLGAYVIIGLIVALYIYMHRDEAIMYDETQPLWLTLIIVGINWLPMVFIAIVLYSINFVNNKLKL